MTEKMHRALVETLTTWSRLVIAASVITAAATTVLSGIIALAFQLWGAALLSAAGVATSDEMTRVKDKVDDLLRRVVVLARPDQIAHYRDLPVPLGGFCFPGEDCVILVFVERDIRALECELIPDSTQLIVTQNGRTFAVPAKVRGTAVNVGTSPRALEPTFPLPRSLEPGEVTARIDSHYTDCLWQTNGDPPATQASPDFKITIVEGAP